MSWADLVTLLFAFFTTMYAMSRVDEATVQALESSIRDALDTPEPEPDEPPAEPQPLATCPVSDQELAELTEETPAAHPSVGWTEAERRARARTRSHVERLLRDPALTGRVEVSPDPRGIRLTLGAAAFFGSGDATLRDEARGSLHVLADGLARHDGTLSVEGHTDDTPVRGGRYRSNWELSTARATEVVAFFIEQHGISPQRLSAAGYAEYRPVAHGDTAGGRARNRRVDIVVIPADDTDEGSTSGSEP